MDPIVEISTCSFDCIYCQLGRIQRVTAERREFIPAAWVREDLRGVDWAAVDVVTISGSGEPTLATNLAAIIGEIRAATTKPILILSNATQFSDPEVRRGVAGVDMIACKLDAPDDAMLARINRPAPGISLEAIVRGIVELRREFAGKLLLQVMFLPANIAEVEAWAPLIRRIGPDEVHLNTPRRPYPLGWYRASRGDHDSAACPFEKRQLKVVTPAEACWAEARLRELTDVPFVSV
ncbi:MAG TPA: radical SAM protein, partial [Candidatus Sumerlaeota bacterium]|nr:radical SAM protein [Candidatus Sumerlaeota bacterium]